MKHISLLFVLSLLITDCFSQNTVNRRRSGVRKTIMRQLERIPMKGLLTETDSTLKLAIIDTNFKPATFIYTFNNNNRCIKEQSLACDSCVYGYLQKALDYSFYKWKKIKEGYYISSRFWNLSMEVITSKPELIVRKMKWTRKQYDALLGQVENF
jgi:hypothetical protein